MTGSHQGITVGDVLVLPGVLDFLGTMHPSSSSQLHSTRRCSDLIGSPLRIPLSFQLIVT